MATFKKFLISPTEYANEIPSQKLETYLRKLSALYYNTSDNLVSDETFDRLKEILEEKDKYNPFLNEIGAPVTHNKVKLPYPMGSLDKIKPKHFKEFDNWKNIYEGPYELSDKLDGISALLWKKGGEIKLYTRGDGIVGQDISHILEYLQIKTDKIPDNTATRGELIISKINFTKIQNQMRNARNAVSGIILSKVVDKTFIQLIEFIAYNIIHPRFLQNEQYNYLLEWNLKIVHHKQIVNLTIEKLQKYFIKRREKSEYKIDGIVVMDNNMVYDISQGNPKYGFAFKDDLNDQLNITTVIDVEWEVSRYNYIKPRIKINPIKMDDVTITYATAHNAKFIYDNKIGIGSQVKIIRSGDVIPKIIEVLTPATSGQPKMPDIPYVRNDTEVDIIATDEDSDVKLISTTKQLVNTMKILNVKYIDEGIMKKLVENGYTTFIKILKADKNEITEIIGAKMTEKIYNGIEYALHNTQLHVFMAASNYFGRGIGIKKLHIITKRYPNILKKTWNDEKVYDKIIALDGFQDKTTEKFVEGFSKFKKFFEKVNKFINIEYLNEPEEETSSKMDSQKVVLTGFRDSNIVEFIEKNGGEVTGNVSSKTTLVVCSDKTEQSSKILKAKDLGIQIMTKDQFLNKYMRKK